VTELLRVLLVEDSASDAKLVVQELERAGHAVQFERVETAQAMRKALDGGTWDLVLSDWSMPRFSAPAALAVMKERGVDLPFIIVSGTVGEELAVEAMRAGAHDYVLKDKIGRLPVAIARERRNQEERTANRRREQEHRQLERRYRRIIETTNEGIFISDREGTISFASARLERMLGYEPGELQGKPMRVLLADKDRAAARESLGRRRTGVAENGEFRLMRKDGTEVWVLRSSNPIMDEEDHFDGMFAMVMDLTDRRRAEEALRNSEAQLLQAQKMEAVGRLAGGIAHDFNNVLSVILSYGDIILEGLAPKDPVREDIEEIRKAASRAAVLTRQLLMLSRQQVFEAKVMDLRDVLLGMDKVLQRILGEDVDLVSIVSPSRARVKVDPGHIEQVILNLVVNARDAMPTGGKLTIETADVVLDSDYAANHVPLKAGSYVLLAVSDTGTGMDRETQKRVFEPFFTTKDRGKGTGLGLSTVFGIVQQSGGHVWVYSEPGKGTTFKVYLPRVDAEVEVLAPHVATATLRGTETILLVEDEEQVRAIVLNILRRRGYSVIVAESAAAALLLSERHPGPIDLLLTDVVMPQMSGPELIKRLASTRPDMKSLCMSGYTGESIVRHGALEPGIAFIQKPITPASLARKVREVLEEERRAPPPSA